MVSFSYTGTQVGTDKIIAGFAGEVIFELGSAEVTWTGGPDLVVPVFVPPAIRIKSLGGQTIFVTESTANLGTTPAAPSTTRYFISTDPIPDPTTARVIGERTIPALAPGKRSDGGTVTLTLPGDLPPGVYHLAACADAPGVIVELDETNNCSFSQFTESRVMSLFLVNQPPNCSRASPSVALLWPPNHKFVTITIQGVVDPDGDLVTIKVTGITQDEPVHVPGSGNTGPDGSGIGSSQAQVRAERSGTGNGRLYFIAFKADDGKGATCIGTVTVGVPHDQGLHTMPVDTWQRYDSMQP